MKQNAFQRRLLPVLALFATISSHAQFDSSFVKSQISKCADSLAYGFRARNWDVFARYSNPAMIGAMGGLDAFKQVLSSTLSVVPENGWKLYKPGTILQVVKSGSDMQCVVELNSILEVEDKLITSKSHLVGQSWDGGIFWTFFDSQNDRVAAKQIKPDLSEQIVIPAKVEDKMDPVTRPSPLKPPVPPSKGNNK